MKREIIPKVKTIMRKALKEAKAYDDVKLRPEHITISIISDDDNSCVHIMNYLGVDLASLYDKLSEHLTSVNINPKVVDINTNAIKPSELTSEVFNKVDEECEKMGDTLIDTTHLILAILDIDCPTSRILSEIGVNYNLFKKTAMELKSDNMKGPEINGSDIRPEVESRAIFDEYADEPALSPDSSKSRRKAVSKTPVLDNFCRDISKAAQEGKIDPVVGRSEEIKRVSQILSRRKKNNPILIGEPGVGKTAIVEGLAQLINSGQAPRVILDKKIYSLDLASIVAGTKYRGQFEERMKAILEETKANPDIILFIDEIHTIVGAGNASGSLDASNIFKPALARGEIQVIGATTLDEYRENIEKDGALTRRFLKVLIEEPSIKETIDILNNIKERYENHHKVTYTPEAIEECAKMADRYITERALPDKAIDVLDEAGASTNVNMETPKHIKDLEAKREDIKVEKMLVVKKQQYEMAAELRDKETKIEKELELAKKKWLESLDKERTIVDVDLVANVISMMTGIPVSKVSSQESKKLLAMGDNLTGQVIGQDDAVIKVVDAIKRNRIQIRKRNKPIGSFIFLGPTGVGKTYLAKLLAEQVFGDADALVRVDMSEYMEKFSITRLIGSPPGYVGYEQGGKLTEAVRRKPYCVVLFDEIEKAHEDVFNLMLQLLDEGHITDSLGRKVDFKNTLIIMTSNIGVRELAQFGKNMGFSTTATIANEEEKARSIIEKALKKKFKPEFLNRIDEAIIFNSLKESDIHKIIKLELKEIEDSMNEQGYKIKFDDEAIVFIAKEGYHPEYGARPLTRAIQRYVEDPVAEEMLSGKIKDGATITVGYTEGKGITVKVRNPKTS